jgi:hypothetical protein
MIHRERLNREVYLTGGVVHFGARTLIAEGDRSEGEERSDGS